MRLGVLGGSFDPPHMAHLFAAVYTISTGKADLVWLVPTYRHPFQKVLSDFEHRLTMCRLAVEPVSHLVQVMDIEKSLGSTSYTVRTLEKIHQQRPKDTLVLIMGSDTLADKEKWKDFQKIEELAELVVIGRRGFENSDTKSYNNDLVLPLVSSTEIRKRVQNGEPIDGLVPSTVKDYIYSHGLYLQGH
ncbi:MAG: nicotinate (nicotinamide) nucleotide adenylyltransferase [Deltaproteobacteria bacterium]|nr:nicotinate (nicotinamide) nucleotide adenylyltransferase [Deltaproteobacteria bacterium]